MSEFTKIPTLPRSKMLILIAWILMGFMSKFNLHTRLIDISSLNNLDLKYSNVFLESALVKISAVFVSYIIHLIYKIHRLTLSRMYLRLVSITERPCPIPI